MYNNLVIESFFNLDFTFPYPLYPGSQRMCGISLFGFVHNPSLNPNYTQPKSKFQDKSVHSLSWLAHLFGSRTYFTWPAILGFQTVMGHIVTVMVTILVQKDWV